MNYILIKIKKSTHTKLLEGAFAAAWSSFPDHKSSRRGSSSRFWAQQPSNLPVTLTRPPPLSGAHLVSRMEGPGHLWGLPHSRCSDSKHCSPLSPQLPFWRRINLFRVGGKEAIGPVSSRCGAERGEPPILRAWACVPSPFPASLSAPLITLPSFSPPRLSKYIFLLLSLASCRPYCSFGYPKQLCYLGGWAYRLPEDVLRLRDVIRAVGYLSNLLIVGQKFQISSDPSPCGQSLNCFANWCHKQEAAPFPPFLKCSHLWCRMLWGEKKTKQTTTVTGLFWCYCYPFCFWLSLIVRWRTPFLFPPHPHYTAHIFCFGDIWCWEVTGVSDNPHYWRTKTFWLLIDW